MNEMTALDTQTLIDVGLVQPETETKVETTVTEQPAVTNTEVPATETVVTETPIEQPSTPATAEFEIDGIGKVTPDEIKEWRSGHMRQSDYTKKTQEVAKQRDELKEAVELFEYLKQNPHLVNQLQELDGKPINREVVSTVLPEHTMMKEIYYNQMNMQIDKQLADIKDKYKVSELNEAELFNKARELGTSDLEFVYRALHYNQTAIDEKSLIEKAKQELKAELERNKSVTQTIVSEKSGTQITNAPTMSDAEKRVAAGMGMSVEDYMKWRDR